MRSTVEFLFVDLCIWNHLGRVEHAQLDACRVQPDQCGINVTFFQEALLVSVQVRLVVAIVLNVCVIQALVVHPALDG